MFLHSLTLPLILPQVAIEAMAARANSLDQYTRKCFAPLGIYFPFPLHCSKLDTYLRREEELRKCGVTGSVAAPALTNEKFWNEWTSIKVNGTANKSLVMGILISILLLYVGDTLV